MSIEINRNIVLTNPETKSFLADAYYKKSEDKLPLVILVHGYKGFKDWGAWHYLAEAFAEAGFYFVKFNFSHNGTTLDDTSNFADLEAFGHNNYSKEMSDLTFVIDYFSKLPEVDASKIALIGHSRGNGNVVIQASEDHRIKALVDFAGISDYASRFPPKEMLPEIKKAGVLYIENKRTKQQMPHYFQFFEDFKANEERFTIENAVTKLSIPYLIIHGSADETVNLREAELLHQWAKNSELLVIENGDHGIGSFEPWSEKQMPKDLKFVTEKSIEFLKDKL